MVRALCGTCGEKITVSQHREKACAAEEDKTQHAEVPKEHWDRFAQGALSLKVARQNKSGPITRSVIKKNRKTLGFALERVERLATKAQDARNELNAKAQSQELQLLVRLEKLFANLEPMSDSIKRYMRGNVLLLPHVCQTQRRVQRGVLPLHGPRGRNLQYLATTCCGNAGAVGRWKLLGRRRKGATRRNLRTPPRAGCRRRSARGFASSASSWRRQTPRRTCRRAIRMRQRWNRNSPWKTKRIATPLKRQKKRWRIRQADAHIPPQAALC